MRKQSTGRLIEEFERDIVYDCHGFVLRFNRSDAQKELSRRGKSALRKIIKHLRQKPPSDFMNLDIAWGRLLGNIETKIDLARTGPELYTDIKGWMEWAERIIKSR